MADGRDVVDEDGRDFSMGDSGNPELAGLANVGVRAFRNSVYAGGGVMAIAVWLPLSSLLIGLGWAMATGKSWSSEGNSMVFGVMIGLRTGLGAILLDVRGVAAK